VTLCDVLSGSGGGKCVLGHGAERMPGRPAGKAKQQPSASLSPAFGYEPKDPDGIGAWVKVGKIHADAPEGKAAAHAWIPFTKFFIRSDNERDVRFAEIQTIVTLP
jgi:hypothetical protein